MIDQMAVDALVDGGQFGGQHQIELVQQHDAGVLFDIHARDAVEQRFAQCARAERIIVFGEVAATEQVGDAGVERDQFLGTVVAQARGGFVHGQRDLEILVADQRQFGQIIRNRRIAALRERIEGLAIGVLAGCQQFVRPFVQDALRAVIGIARFQQGGPVRHGKQRVLHGFGLVGQRAGGTFDQHVAAGVQQAERLGRCLGASCPLELIEVNDDGIFRHIRLHGVTSRVPRGWPT